MAAFDTTRTTYGSNGLFSRIASALTNIAGSVIAWNDARVTRNALSKLSARELDDIGLTYSDINAIAQRVIR